MFAVPTGETLWVRAQLRWLGHLARAGDDRVAVRVLGAVRAEAGHVGHGNRGASLLGVFGQQGTLLKHLTRSLTVEARRRFFGGRRGEWFELAEEKNKWRNFVNSISIRK